MQKTLNTALIIDRYGADLHNIIDSERELVEKAKSDSASFGILFDRYYDSVYRYTLYRTANITAAEELTSETFYKALNKLWTFKWRGIPFSAWLIRIASNEVKMYFRKSKSFKGISLDETDKAVSENLASTEEIKNTELSFSQNLLFKQLHNSLAELKIIYQEVIILKYFEEKSIKEIAEILGKSEGTVKSLIHRGLNKLKDKIDPSLYKEVKNG